MQKFMIAMLCTVIGAGCTASSQKPAESSSATSQSSVLDDMDYQIKITKEAIQQYKTRAFFLDEKGQTLLDHDYMGYRHAEMLSQQAQAVANDLAQRLQQLEEQRAEMVKELGSKQSQPKPIR